MLSWQEFVFEFSTIKLPQQHKSSRTLFEAMRSIASFISLSFFVSSDACLFSFCFQ
jgi:hypothetical protein